MKLQKAIIKGSILLENTSFSFKYTKLQGKGGAYKESTTIYIFNFWICYEINNNNELNICVKYCKQISDKITLPLYEKIKEVVSKEQLIFVNI